MHFPKTPVNGITYGAYSVANDYGDLVAEKQALRTSAGFLDLSETGLVRVSGPDAASLLQGLVTQDVVRQPVGQARAAFFLDANGKVIALVRLWRVSSSCFWLLTPPGEAEALIAHIGRYLIMEDATLEQVTSHVLWSVQGPMASESTRALFDFAPDGLLWTAQDRSGLGGFDLLCPLDALEGVGAGLLSAGTVPIGRGALEPHRIATWKLEMGREILPGDNAMLFGLNEAFSASKGCYIGQETVARTRDRGRPPRLLTLLSRETRTLPQPGSPVIEPQERVTIGEWRSSTLTENGALAFALIGTSALEKGVTHVESDAQLWSISKIATYKV